MTDVKKFVIERDRWLRGEKDNVRLLRPSDGKMCCLGFFGLACGIPEEKLRGLGEPNEVHNEAGKEVGFPDWLVEFREADEDGDDRFVDSDDCGELMGENDSTSTDEPTRESRIAEIFAKHGVTVEFK